MNISSIQSHVNAADIPIEDLAGNKALTEQQKVDEASRQFAAILLRQVLSETQKPVIQSEFTDNSTAAGIYQDYITNVLADSMSKSGAFGLAKIFEQQLSRPASTADAGSHKNLSATHP
jgi:Rod binding domain-containing protein